MVVCLGASYASRRVSLTFCLYVPILHKSGVAPQHQQQNVWQKGECVSVQWRSVGKEGGAVEGVGGATGATRARGADCRVGVYSKNVCKLDARAYEMKGHLPRSRPARARFCFLLT